MSTTTTTYVDAPEASLVARPSFATRIADYLELIKPRIAVMGLLTVAFGYTLGSQGVWNAGTLVCALVGIGCVAAACSALNQVIEQQTDALMNRTARRPVPAGRISTSEATAFGCVLAVFGVVYLAISVNLLTAVLSLATLLLYVAAYTPLKRTSTLCTAVGAIPGAMPPILGWTAAGGSLDVSAFSLFAILFLWQFPHFLAIGWLYRHDYERAGLKMVPASSSVTGVIGTLACGYAAALWAVSLLPSQLSLAGDFYAWTAVVLGFVYFAASVRFALSESQSAARKLLWTSLVYLPLLLAAMTWDHFRLLQ